MTRLCVTTVPGPPPPATIPACWVCEKKSGPQSSGIPSGQMFPLTVLWAMLPTAPPTRLIPVVGTPPSCPGPATRLWVTFADDPAPRAMTPTAP